MEGAENILATVGSKVVEISTWFWETLPVIFASFINNPLILWSFIFAVASGVILLFFKIIRKFGFKQKR